MESEMQHHIHQRTHLVWIQHSPHLMPMVLLLRLEASFLNNLNFLRGKFNIFVNLFFNCFTFSYFFLSTLKINSIHISEVKVHQTDSLQMETHQKETNFNNLESITLVLIGVQTAFQFNLPQLRDTTEQVI